MQKVTELFVHIRTNMLIINLNIITVVEFYSIALSEFQNQSEVIYSSNFLVLIIFLLWVLANKIESSSEVKINATAIPVRIMSIKSFVSQGLFISCTLIQPNSHEFEGLTIVV